MQKRKCFVCRGFRYITYHCKSRRDIKENRRIEIGEPEHQLLSNRFEALTNRVIKIDISNKGEEKKEKVLREVIVKIGLKQEDEDEEMTVGQQSW